MGTCSSSKVEENNTNLILIPNEIFIIRNSWKLVVEGGLDKYGTNMMIR